MGRGTSPADEGVEERCKLPQQGPGQSPGRKRVLMHLEPVYFKEFSLGDIALPFITLLSPHPLFLPLPPFSSLLVPFTQPVPSLLSLSCMHETAL